LLFSIYFLNGENAHLLHAMRYFPRERGF